MILYVNRVISIDEFNNSFRIINESKYEGYVIFSDTANLNILRYHMPEDSSRMFNIKEMIKEQWIDFKPTTIQFRTEGDIDYITVINLDE